MNKIDENVGESIHKLQKPIYNDYHYDCFLSDGQFAFKALGPFIYFLPFSEREKHQVKEKKWKHVHVNNEL
jgi:hypothetical protein